MRACWMALTATMVGAHVLGSSSRPALWRSAAVAGMATAAKFKFPSGLIAVYKPPDCTSADCVAKIKAIIVRESKRHRIGDVKFKVGHGGTLDPFAEGVLVMGLGEGTKLLQNYLKGSKKYIAVAKIGSSTDTLDRMGVVVEECARDHVTKEMVTAALPFFTGSITQTPPMFSALKVNGERLYDLARRGVEVERAPRPCFVYGLEVLDQQDLVGAFRSFPPNKFPPCSLPDHLALSVECSGGFYVRSLVQDLARRVHSAGYLTHLLRTKHTMFELRDCLDMTSPTFDYSAICENLRLCSEKAGIPWTCVGASTPS